MIMTPRTAWLLLPLMASCWVDTQRYPGPMLVGEGPLGSGNADLYQAGPEEVLVTRLADPVFVRRPGEVKSFPLYYYRKQERLNAGSWIFAGAGGRAEVLYPGGTSVTLFGRGAGAVGSAGRGEPIFFIHELDRAILHLDEDAQVRLLGGALLTANGGPIALERLPGDVLRLTNRSGSTCWVAYREEVFQIDPAEVVDMPLLDGGTGPLEEAEGFKSLRVGGEGQRLHLRGDVEVVQEPGATVLRATGPHEVLGLGLRLRLDPGDEVRLSGLEEPMTAQEPNPE
jgi:hypothetical protein